MQRRGNIQLLDWLLKHFLLRELDLVVVWTPFDDELLWGHSLRWRRRHHRLLLLLYQRVVEGNGGLHLLLNRWTFVDLFVLLLNGGLRALEFELGLVANNFCFLFDGVFLWFWCLNDWFLLLLFWFWHYFRLFLQSLLLFLLLWFRCSIFGCSLRLDRDLILLWPIGLQVYLLR